MYLSYTQGAFPAQAATSRLSLGARIVLVGTTDNELDKLLLLLGGSRIFYGTRKIPGTT